ncbi:MAG: polysaccharide deacetylase family protein [Candidatus Bathyarchaeia archaeon]
MTGKLSITFDDGLASVRSLALPELEKIGATATVFVISDLIGKEFDSHPVMDERQLRYLISRDWEIGSHTRTHPNLFDLADVEVDAEFRNSKTCLEEITSTKIDSMAYPFGHYDNRIKAIAARYYSFARGTSSFPPLKVNSVNPQDRMALGAVSTYAHPFSLPMHLLYGHVLSKLSYRPRGKIKTTSRGLESRFIRKWIQHLRKNQWLILAFHDLSEQETFKSYTIGVREFREIAKIISRNVDVVNINHGMSKT